jgi:acyl-CoA thioester hydrolase
MNMHRVSLRPIFGDVDAMNVVYYGNYLRFFERGRAELMRSQGRPYADLEAQGLHLPVVEAHVRYHRPARYDDLLVVETKVAWVKKASLQFNYRILKDNGQDEEDELVTGYTVHGCTTHQGKIVPLPAWMANTLKTFTKSA